MRSIIKILVFTFVSLITISCASTAPLTQSEIEKVKIIAIHSELPAYPAYNIVGATRFDSTISTIPDSNFRERAITTASNYLRSKGYEVIDLSKNQNTDGKKVDMMLSFYATKGGNGGYGVWQQVTFGVIASAPSTFVSIAVVPSFGPGITRKAGYSEKFTKLTVKKLTSDWGSLPRNDKDEIVKALNSDIELAIADLMKQLGM